MKALNKKSNKITEVLKNWVIKADADIKKTKIDWFNSGSTCCLALIKDNSVYLGKCNYIFINKHLQLWNLANTGDSKAVLFQFKEPAIKIIEDSKSDHVITDRTPCHIVSIHSTQDHDFEVDKEYRRVMGKLTTLLTPIGLGGKIEKFNGNLGPLR